MHSRTSASLALLLTLAMLPACDMQDMTASSAAASAAGHASRALVAPAWAAHDLGSTDVIADVAERSVRSVVHIASKRNVRTQIPPQLRFMMPDGPSSHLQRGAGSGVIVGDGLILTNNHVIDGAETLVVTLSDGRTFDAHVQGADPATDLAIVALDGDVPKDLPALAFGDSDALRLGEVVLAIGSPFELQGTVTMGIISARGRQMGLARYEDFIQTDAAINPGNSGGALVALDGTLVGINTAIGSRSGGNDGIGFAIPSRLARDIMNRLVRDGRVVRGYLGVLPTDVPASAVASLGLTTGRGALIAEVTPGSAADRGGLKTYDVIVSVDGDPIDDASDLRNTVSLKGADTPVTVGVVREGRPRDLRIVLGTLETQGAPDEAPAPEATKPTLGGVRLLPLEGQVRQRLGLQDQDVQGVVVASVDPSSQAAEVGLLPGDIIVEINRKPVQRVEDVGRLTSTPGPWMVRVRRGEMHTVVFLEG